MMDRPTITKLLIKGLPVTDAYVSRVINQAKLGSSSTLLGIPGIGKTFYASKIMSEIKRRKEPIITCYIDVANMQEKSAEGFFREMLSALMTETTQYLDYYSDGTKLQKLKNEYESLNKKALVSAIREVLVEFLGLVDFNVLFLIEDLTLLDNQDEAFFNALSRVYMVNRDRITYYFLDNPPFHQFLENKQADSMVEPMFTWLKWAKLPSRQQFDEQMKGWSKILSAKFSPEQVEYIWNETNGHPGLSKYLAIYMSETTQEVSASEFLALSIRLHRIADSLTSEEILVLHRIANGFHINFAQYSDVLDMLLKYDLLKEHDGNFKIKIRMFEEYIRDLDVSSDGITSEPKQTDSNRNEQGASITEQNKAVKTALQDAPTGAKKTTSSKKTLGLTIEKGNVYVNGTISKEDFSKRELSVLQLLIDQRGVVVSRDKLADAIWGKDATFRYSDWAIDQTISRIRKKLGDNSRSPKFIKTIRGRGFKLLV